MRKELWRQASVRVVERGRREVRRSHISGHSNHNLQLEGEPGAQRAEVISWQWPGSANSPEPQMPLSDEAGLRLRWELKSATGPWPQHPGSGTAQWPTDESMVRRQAWISSAKSGLLVRVKVWVSSCWTKDNIWEYHHAIQNEGGGRVPTVASPQIIPKQLSSWPGACTYQPCWPWAQGHGIKNGWKW